MTARPKRLLTTSTEEWMASPNTASEWVVNPTRSFTMTTAIFAMRMPPRTRRTFECRSIAVARLGISQSSYSGRAVSTSRLQDRAFQVGGFGNREHVRVVLALGENLPEDHGPAAVAGGVGEHLEEFGKAHVERAGRREQGPARRQATHRAEVDLAVAAESGRHRDARLGERRRVEHDGI